MANLKAPFVYFGGKSAVAELVWQRFGKVPGYVEPFFGSGAVLLGRPTPFDGVETVNDKSGYIANFWRAVAAEPAAVADHADWPANENDLHARHAWLTARRDTLSARLEGDPDWFDSKIAGWWAWGMALWIGSEFCSGKGPWHVVDGELVKDGEGQGAHRQRIHLANEGQGVHRQRIHLGDAGRGVHRQLIHLGDAGRGVGRHKIPRNGLLQWMEDLAERLRRVRVCCGGWRRVCGGQSGNALGCFFASGQLCAIFLDPPYSGEAGRDNAIYTEECLSVAHDVRQWAIRHGGDQRLRICYCGYDNEEMPGDWAGVNWKARAGYGNLNNTDDDTQAKQNRSREMLWFSPHCIQASETPLFD